MLPFVVCYRVGIKHTDLYKTELKLPKRMRGKQVHVTKLLPNPGVAASVGLAAPVKVSLHDLRVPERQPFTYTSPISV